MVTFEDPQHLNIEIQHQHHGRVSAMHLHT